MSTVPICQAEGCTNDSGGNEYCRQHECGMGGCSRPTTSGDGDGYCSTHECAVSGCGEHAYGTEYYCVDHGE
jgi:hypothetical protein